MNQKSKYTFWDYLAYICIYLNVFMIGFALGGHQFPFVAILSLFFLCLGSGILHDQIRNIFADKKDDFD